MKPNVPWWTNVWAKSSLLSVKAVRIAPRSRRRTARRGAIAAAATSQRCARLTPSRGDEHGSLDVGAQPELEHQQAPEPVAVIRATRLVVGEQSPDLAGVEPAAVVIEQVVGGLLQVLPEPSSERHPESGLAAARDSRGQLCLEGPPERDLALTPAGLERVGQREPELDHLVVEERRAQLERVRHGRNVCLEEEVA